MKYSGVFFMIASLLFVSCVSEPALPTEEEAIAAIKEKIEFGAERWAKGDASGYADLAAEDISYMDDIAAPEILVGKEQQVAYIEKLAVNVPLHKPILSAFHWQFYGDIMVITYRYQSDFDGKLSAPWRITSVFRYANNEWLSVHENWSLVKEPATAPDE